MKIKVGVIFGGESVEHEVSIISAIQAINSMDTEKYDILNATVTIVEALGSETIVYANLAEP